ncbi:TipJ family phage tail tip protein [Ewingella allii]|uniref:host specificity protein J n=1 Tax=Ewingella allii TaxID=3092550 RepID=UPI0037B00320
METATLIKGRKGGSSGGSTPTESPDDLQSNDIAKILVALGNGEWFGGLSGSNIYLDGTDIDSLGGNIKWEFRPGTQQQTYIQGMPSVENGITIDAEIKSNTNWVRAISNTQLDAVRLTFNWPALQEQKTNGDVVGYRIEYAIDLATDGGAFQQIISTAVDGKTTTTYQRSHRITLPKATTGWQIRIRRITANANSARIADTMKLGMLTEVIDAKLRYPNTALLYVEFNAKQFPNRIPQISCKPKMAIIRVPDNYDPIARTYTGTWLGNFKWAWSNNPAWVFYDIVTSEMYGLGHRIDATQIDRYELYRIAQYCDQLVPDGRGGTGMEPRFLCDVYLQSQEEAWTVLTDLAGIFRGMTYWGDNQMVALADMPRDIDYTYTRASVINGKFTYSSGSERVRYSSAMVGYSNPINHYADDVEPVPEPDLVKRYGFNPLDITAIGCTRQSEANRRGRWALLSNAKDSVVTFNVGLDGHLSPPGRIIAVADPRRAGRAMGGRISEVSGRNITLDRVADVKPNDRLLLNLPSGKSQARTVQAVVGKVVTVTAAYSEVPEAQTVWAVDADDLFVQQYRVTSLTDNGDNTFTISAVFHDPDKYERIDTGARIEDRPISVIPPGVQSPPTGIVISSFSSVSQGIAVTTMHAQWNAPDNAVAYEAQWRKDNGNWISIPRTSTASFDVTGIYAGRYLVRVRAINASEISSVWATSIETQLNGKEGKPPMPVGFRATAINWGIQLDWGYPDAAEDTRHIEIQYAQSSDGANALLLTDVPYPARTYTQLGLKAGQVFWYHARLVDKTGNESDWTDWIRGIANDNPSDYIEDLDNQIKASEAFKNLSGQIDVNTEALIETAIANDADIQRRRVVDGKNAAEFLSITTLIATNDSAYAQKFEQLTAISGQNSAAVQQVSTAVADLNGKLSAQWGIKVQVDSNGVKYGAGMQLGVEGSGGSVQSYALFSADTFGVYNPNNGSFDLAFVIKNGQTFIKEAFIDYAVFTLAKVGSWYSANYIAGQSGTIMRADGSFEFNGYAPGQGRVTLDSRGLRVYDASGNIKVKIGDLR